MNEQKVTKNTRDVFVLSGGASRGAVQVGMMQTLIEAGIVPDGLVGSSVGALNAAFMGWQPGPERVSKLADQWLRLQTRDIFPGGNWTRLSHLARRHSYLFDSYALSSLIHAWVPVRNLEELTVPVRITTTPLASCAAKYHDRGPIEKILLASAAVPGVFEPVELVDEDGARSTHVDGGVADLIPVAGTVALAPTRVFVLDATVPVRIPRARTPIEILIASLGIAVRVRPMPDLGPDVEVHHLTAPDLGTGMIDFSRSAEHIALGRKVAAELVESLGVKPAPLTDRPHRFWDRFSKSAA
ncbi:patatin-like phospholipase family protein [Nocardioides marmorisolisilvae]|nr:patatin-like phospholipase family protein [Nocardioides marmorisolisilvae]